jgi:hypothetical protein
MRKHGGDNQTAFPSLASGSWKLAGAALGLLAVLAVLFFLDPATSSWFPPCPFHAWTGLYCPGCGTLRGLHQLLHGNLPAAFGLNPLMLLCLPFIAYGLLSELLQSISGRRLPARFVPGPCIWLLLAVILLFCVLRNVPLYPFSLLAP